MPHARKHVLPSLVSGAPVTRQRLSIRATKGSQTLGTVIHQIQATLLCSGAKSAGCGPQVVLVGVDSLTTLVTEEVISRLRRQALVECHLVGRVYLGLRGIAGSIGLLPLSEIIKGPASNSGTGSNPSSGSSTH